MGSFSRFLAACTLLTCSACSTLQSYLPSDTVGIAGDLYKGATVSDEEIKGLAIQFAQVSDSQAKIKTGSDKYAARLARLVKPHLKEDGLTLNFKVYEDEEVNAFAFADGSIRFYSGIMDIMEDDELLAIIGHEIGHVKLGHTKEQTRAAYLTSAALKTGTGAVSASTSGAGGAAGRLGADVVAKLLEQVIGAQFSQASETEADEYALQFLKRHNYKTDAEVRALKKFAALSEKGDALAQFVSSHPDSESRAEHIEELIGKKVAIADKPAAPAAEKKSVTETKPATASPQAANLKAEPSVQVQPAAKSDTARAAVPSRFTAGWHVQLASYRSAEEAGQRQKALVAHGVTAVIRPAVVRGIQYYRVLVGPFNSQGAARAKMQEIEALGATEEQPFVHYVE